MATKEKSPDPTDKELEELTTKLHDGFDIQDRKYHLQSFPKCFIAKEAVTWMVSNEIAASREDAVSTGQLLVAAGIIHHVTDDAEFADEHLFFRFQADEPLHGTKEKKPNSNEPWSWSDFSDIIPGKFKKLFASSSRPENDAIYNTGPMQPGVPDAPDAPESEEKAANNSNDADAAKTAKSAESDEKEVSGAGGDHSDTFGISPMDEFNQLLLDNVHPVKWIEPEVGGDRYNMVAIGAGAAGLVTTSITCGLGGKAAIIEENLFGGDCLNSGCVPSKALLKAAKVANSAIKRMEEFGLELEGNDAKLKVNFGKVMERMRKVRSKISYHDACEKFTKKGLDVFLGHAEFVSENEVKVNGKVLQFTRCVIATGGKPAVPPIPGLSEVKYLTNHSLWNLTELPQRLCVIGAGPIGCEMAQSFALFGSNVTVIDLSPRILGKEDIEAANVLQEVMQKDGVTFHTGAKTKEIKYTNDSKQEISVNVELSDGSVKTLLFDKILIAAGRKPNVSNMGLEVAKVKFSEKFGIEVNNHLQTSNSSIYAAGDCCTRYQFTHMADAMARIVVRNSLFFGRSKVSDLIIPWCTYTSPEVAHVGLYEKDLKERNIEFDVLRVGLKENDRVICDGDDFYEGFVKVLVKKGSDKIMGATIVSENAGDQINELTLAIQGDLGLGFIAGVIHPYPTVAEGVKHAGDAFNRTKLTPVSKALLRRILQARRKANK